MPTPEQGEHNKQVYRRFVDILNAQDFDALPEVVDPATYHEDCIGFTPGRVNLADAIAAYRRVLVGIPDLRADIIDCVAEENKVYARLRAHGTNTGNFFGAPPTHQYYQVNMFDYVELANGKIVERVQQSDALSQLRQMYAGTLKRTGVVLGSMVAGSIAGLVVQRLRRRTAT